MQLGNIARVGFVEELIEQTADFITRYSVWAGPIVGLLAFGESLAFVGLLIPATALMLAVGGLIGSGVVDPLPVYIWAAAGAIAGDWISYAIGRKIGPSVYRHRLLTRYRSSVARARLFFRKYGILAVFLGRFLGPLRSTVPLVAGVMDMRQRPFQIANIASAILWVPVMFAPGFVAARSLGSLEEVTGTHLLGVTALAVVLTVVATMIGARVMGQGARKG